MIRRPLRAVFIKADGYKTIEEVCRIAKAEIERLGLYPSHDFIQVRELVYLPRCGGFAVVVESVNNVMREREAANR